MRNTWIRIQNTWRNIWSSYSGEVNRVYIEEKYKSPKTGGINGEQHEDYI